MILVSVMASQSSPKKKVWGKKKIGRKLKLQNFTFLKLSSLDSYGGFLSLQESET